MARENVQMPASTAGLTRYFDDYKSKLELSPWAIVGACCAVAVLIIALHAMA